MPDAPSDLFPLIMDILSHKPLLSETQDNLLRDVKEKLKEQGYQVRNLKQKLNAAIDSGKLLGILTVLNDEVRMSFLVNRRSLPTNQSTGNKSAPGSSDKRGPNDRQVSYRSKGNSSDDDSRGKYRGRSRSRSRSRSRRRSLIQRKRFGRSRRRN